MRSVKAFMYAALMLMLLPVFAGAAPEMVVSGEYFQTGDVVDLVINDGEGATAVYTVFRDEVQIFQGTEDTHLRVSYRPRTEGSYRILADLTLADGTQQAVEAAFTVEGERKEKLEDVYSQRDGWWADRSYRTSTLEHSGCAIFALSHALSRMGVTDAETMPASLGVTYASCLITGGTSNVRLISQAAQVYNYETQSDLISSKAAIQRQFDDGAMFSFAIVSGHIALADAISEDGSKVRVVDSAPGVTQERIKGGKRYWREESGAFRKISDLSEIDECRYYLETAQYGGLIYWLDLSYVAQRGVRLIKPYQVSMHNAEGTEVPVKLETFGTAISQVQVNGKSRTIPTEELSWRHTTENRMTAYVTGRSGAALKDAQGKKRTTVPGFTVLPVLEEGETTVRVRYGTVTGLIDKSRVEVSTLGTISYTLGKLALNGSVSGRAKIRVRETPGGRLLGEYATGTQVTVFGEEDGSLAIEIEGRRGYVQSEYVLPEEEGV